MLPIRPCPAHVSWAGCVLPSSPSPGPWRSHARRTRREKTPHPHPAGVPCHRTPPPAWRRVLYGRVGSSRVLCPGFPFRAYGAIDPASVLPSGREPLGPPTFCDVSLPACRGLWTPADLRLLAHADALVWPSVRVNTLGVRSTRVSTRSQPFRGRGHPYGLPDARSTLRPSCSSWSAYDSAMDARLETGG